ncbi:MAG: hypothetical protein M1839_009094 [Geoglossum umbratile]|nr:MAG: hypothetical protein M1839_009094 [Geoglossum umbratile]
MFPIRRIAIGPEDKAWGVGSVVKELGRLRKIWATSGAYIWKNVLVALAEELVHETDPFLEHDIPAGEGGLTRRKFSNKGQFPESPSEFTSEFPNYADGDVLITFAAKGVYKLHAYTLRANSVVFNGLLNPNNIRSPTGKGKKSNIRFRIEYVPVGEDDDIGEFRLLALTLRQHPNVKANTQLVLDNQNGKSTAAYARYRDFDNLFRVMYNQDAIVVEDDDMGSTLAGCMGLLEVAEKTRAVRVVSPVIEHALLRRGQVLYRSIQSNPIAWSDLAMRIKSGRLFEESIIHLVGQWQSLTWREKAYLATDVRSLCERKHEDLKAIKKSIDLRLLGLYPAELLLPLDETPGRNKYSSKIYMWMALCYFRQWLAQSLAEGQGWSAPDGGARLYRKLAAGQGAYLDGGDMQNFHRYFPMSHKAQSCLEERVARIKQEATGIVAELMSDQSQLDQRPAPVDYLTCCSVDRTEYPWATAAAPLKDPASPAVISNLPHPPTPPPWPPAADTPPRTSRSRSRSSSPLSGSRTASTPTSHRSRSPFLDPRLRGA